jgi:thiol-disulfide isomerase/thioredoxin
VKSHTEKSHTEETMAKAPKGPAVLWMRRLANIGFGIAAAYFLYLMVLLGMAAKNNSEFQGTMIGETQLQQVISGFSASQALVPLTPATASQQFGFSLDALNLSQVTSKTVVVMWATWCGPCHALLISLRDEVTAGKISAKDIVAVSMAEPLADVSAYLQKTPLPFSIALDPKGELATKMKVSGTPTVILLEPGGKINSVSTGGFRLASKVVEFLSQASAE